MSPQDRAALVAKIALRGAQLAYDNISSLYPLVVPNLLVSGFYAALDEHFAALAAAPSSAPVGHHCDCNVFVAECCCPPGWPKVSSAPVQVCDHVYWKGGKMAGRCIECGEKEPPTPQPSAPACSRCDGDRGNAGGAVCEHCHGTGVEPSAPPSVSDTAHHTCMGGDPGSGLNGPCRLCEIERDTAQDARAQARERPDSQPETATCSTCRHARPVRPSRVMDESTMRLWCACPTPPTSDPGTLAPTFDRRVPDDYSCSLYKAKP